MRVLRPAGERPGFAKAADALLGGHPVELPQPRTEFLRWLGANRPVVFHGSQRNDLTELSTERRSTDATAWGNQRAVYASSDPVWSIYFATLRRDNGWQGTRNGTLGIGGGRRYYFFAHNRGSESPDRFGPGTLYLLPLDTFEAQPKRLGIDPSHLISKVPVKPFARIPVTPDDFPFRDGITYYKDDERLLVTMLRR